jgi:putative FmdB family regulatory protein
MPIYEYRCEKCGDFERTQRITDEPLQRCPKCRRKVRRLISNTSFQLKGSGWYVTDYARAKNGKGDSADGATKADGSNASSDTPAKVESSKTESSKTESSKTESSKAETSKTPRPGKSAGPATKPGSAAKSGS